MDFFHLLGALSNRVTKQNSKVHLAVHDGTENPIDVYLAGNFDTWQARQANRNFSARDYVISLIQLPGDARWLFVGCYKKHDDAAEDGEGYLYTLEFLEEYRDLAGRLVVHFERPSRQSYIYGETASAATVDELMKQRMSVSEFKGFKYVRLPFKHLETIVKEEEPSWRSALSSVAGIYIISDPEANKLYVGSASGVGGIWGRWSQYVDGHGNNKMLKELVGAEGIQRAEYFRFSILEIADIQTAEKDIIVRENHWKDVLLTRQGGYNAAEGRRATAASTQLAPGSEVSATMEPQHG